MSADPNAGRSEYVRSGQIVLELLDAAATRPEQWPAVSWNSEVQRRLVEVAPLPETGRALEDLIRSASAEVLQGYCNVSHPLYFGYISPKPHPAAVLGDALASGLNQTPGAWRAGPSATAVEVETLSWICELLGYPRADNSLPNGIFTGGGTIANLIALKLARDRLRERGVRIEEMRVYMSVEGHFSVGKALDVLAVGKESLRLIGTDADGRLSLPALQDAIRDDIAAGHVPMAIVGVAGTSATAAVDPLEQLATIAREHAVWFHIDGAAGAVYSALDATSGLFRGLALADSLTLDPCKWMFVPFGMGCLLVKDGRWLSDSFWSTGHYWEELDELDTFKMNLYGTRQWRSLGLWMLLSHLGRSGYTALLENMRDAARHFAGLISKDDRYELLAVPQLPVLAFRIAAGSAQRRSDLTRQLQRRLVADGEVYVTMMDWRGEDYIRIAVNNYATSVRDMDRLKGLVDDAYAVGLAVSPESQLVVA